MIWKILFVIYALVIGGLQFTGYLSMMEVEQTVSGSEALMNTLVEVILVFAMIYTFALGWKKRLISEKWNKIFFWFSIVAFILSGVIFYKGIYSPMYSEMILQAMENGMVPRHWDFQVFLIVTRIEAMVWLSLLMFVVFGPFYLGYYNYSKTMNLLGTTKNAGRKCFTIYLCVSALFTFLIMFLGLSGNVMNFNIFDCLSILSTVYIIFGLIGYAFNKEFLNQLFWRITLPLCVVVELLPASFYSADFKNIIGYDTLAQSPIYMLSSYLMTAVAIYMVYLYASTDAVFKPLESEE